MLTIEAVWVETIWLTVLAFVSLMIGLDEFACDVSLELSVLDTGCNLLSLDRFINLPLITMNGLLPPINSDDESFNWQQRWRKSLTIAISCRFFPMGNTNCLSVWVILKVTRDRY